MGRRHYRDVAEGLIFGSQTVSRPLAERDADRAAELRRRSRSRDRVEDRRLAASARYPAPTVDLPPRYRFATNGHLLRYIAGGGGRYTN